MTRLLATLRQRRRERAYRLVADDILAMGPRYCFTASSAFWSTQMPHGRAVDAESALLLLDAVKRETPR